VIAKACDPAASADIAAVVMNEGIANICLVTESMTLLRQKVEQAIPRKRKAAAFGHEKAMKSFFENTMQGILRHIDFNQVKVIIVASPGFIKDQFMEFVHLEAQRRELREFIEHKTKFILCKSSSGHKHALNEILSDPNMAVKLADTQASRDISALNEFYNMLNVDSDRAFYGFPHVNEANERGAIQVLMVTDTLFRNADVATRKKYVKLVEDVKAGGGVVHLFSSLHSSGDQLKQLTGVAAILRFPVPDIDENDPEDESDSDSESESGAEDDSKERADDLDGFDL